MNPREDGEVYAVQVSSPQPNPFSKGIRTSQKARGGTPLAGGTLSPQAGTAPRQAKLKTMELSHPFLFRKRYT